VAAGLAEIVLLGLLAAWLFRLVRIPGLIGMLFIGVLLGPHVSGLLDPSFSIVGGDLRLIALIVILLRAGFELSAKALRRVGLRASLLSFVPALTEGAAVVFLGPVFLDLTLIEAALLASVLAAVSPAVVVPYMIRLIEERRGTEKGIPTMVLAASSLDDVFVIVVYGVLISLYTGSRVSIAWSAAAIPLSIVVGILTGVATGFFLYRLFERFNPRATKRVLIVLGVSVLFTRLEHLLDGVVPFAGLLAVMAVGFYILKRRESFAHEISAKLGKIWVFAEVLLFSLVGAQVNIDVALDSGLAGAALIAIALVFRSLGVFLSLLGSDLDWKERLFTAVAYMPKATVQAAIGGAPLLAMQAAGMPTAPGDTILATAVLSIILTAPLGAWAMELLSGRLLTIDQSGRRESFDAALESDADDGLDNALVRH
jgi:solute carrier family 9B (sodium/hydrogen exchanger), member 1/2